MLRLHLLLQVRATGRSRWMHLVVMPWATRAYSLTQTIASAQSIGIHIQVSRFLSVLDFVKGEGTEYHKSTSPGIHCTMPSHHL